MIYPESILRQPLPPMPEWFEKELAQVATRNGVPVFRIVNGMTEQKFRNGKYDVKHLLQTGGVPCYVTVSKTRYRRRNFRSGEYQLYTSLDKAKADKTKYLSHEIDVATIEKRVGVGRPCWVVEVYIAPEEICYDTWQSQRYGDLEKNNIIQKIDILGEFPRDGMYMACFDVIDDEGDAVSPSERTLEECRRRWKIATGDTRTAEQAIQATHDAIAAFEQKALDKMNENALQWMGITKTRAKGGVIGKPILAEK